VSREERAAHEAFTAGLLHDVGRIVLASNLPEEYAAILTAAREHHRPLNDEEFDHLGVTHAQVGAYLLGKWGMPAHFVEATALHHAPDHALTREFGVLAAVHIADALTYDTERAPPEKPDENREEDPSQPQLNAAYLKALNLPTSLAEWRKELAGEAVAREPQAEAPPASPPSEQAPPTATSSDAHHPAVDRSRSRLRFGVPALAVLAVTASLLAWAYHSLAPRPAAAPFRPESGGAKADPAPVGGAAESAVNAQPAAEAPPAPPAPEAAPAPVNTPALAPTPVARETDTPGPGANSVSPPPAPAKAAAKGFASVKLQGIFYGAKNPVAMINGETYGCGDRVNGVQILAITASGVTLSYEGAQKVLQLP